ncbi:hypothetical protein Q4520_18235 [Alteromonas sp. 1_MG-2023]|uniref:hypothetical protein n=1 Tax=Alteromonas sp. 1_MG-2023 TaxID=3062669 RepID=UPI0026E1C8F8|nr:hypothetical protein [Alteromonas sp. 1_MG-2023]MDO6477364.1 hypothetical protein [Alteromonas sp. 1_MG-2023]
MIDLLKIWVASKSWFWKFRAWLGKISFAFERSAYKTSASVSKAKANTRILGSFTWIGVKSLFWVTFGLTTLIFVDDYVNNNLSWLSPLSADDKKFNIEQLRLYAQLLTAIFSIYFATIGIILSAGYTRLRRDIIQMLTNEQVGSVYSQVLVLSAMFCLTATALPSLGLEPGLLVYAGGTILTLLSALALFPLGQRIFNFFDLNILVGSEILPNIARHIEGAANPKNSNSLANHHSKAARLALEQLSYIDDRVKAGKEGLENKLPALTDDYTALLLHYLKRKHTIDQESYWFPRRSKHKEWFLAGDTATSMALKMSSQQLLVEEKPDRQWFENELVDRLAGHIELAFQVGDFDLALKLIGRFSTRISAYAARFQFEIGMQELKIFKEIIEQAFASLNPVADDKSAKIQIGIADTWAALGSNLCLETLRRMFTFEKELERFFERDEWSEKSLSSLPAIFQVELAFIVERIEFEQEFEGQRLSKPKYVQQLAVQRLLQYYAKVLPAVCGFYQNLLPDFVESLSKLKMSESATQVVLASLHSHWKLPRWFDELVQLMDRYHKYGHYTEEQYNLPEINIVEMAQQLASARDDAITRLGSGTMVGHIFEPKHNDELPDHFGQVYFELAEACISALEQNDESKLNKVLPMFMSLAFLAADSRFTDPSLDVNNEFRLHLISTVINDLASVLGFAILYGAYFDNEKLSAGALAKFDAWIKRATDKQQYFKRMVLLSNPHSFSFSASPRGLIRINWKMSFERRAREDGFENQMGMMRGGQHPNRIVREFMKSHADASHLFFADQIVPQLDPIDFDIDYHITNLARRLRESLEEVQHENI